MRRKLALIFALAVVFAAVLVFRPWESSNQDIPRFFDRLPDADLIGKANVLALSESLEQSTYYYRIPFREFLTREFILLQAKSFGVDVQKPAYFFANESEWQLEDAGAMLIVKDSSLIRPGIQRLSRFIRLSDTSIYNQTVFRNAQKKLTIAYGEDWMLVYHGDKFKRTFHDVLYAKKNEIPPRWRAFLNHVKFDGTPLVANLTSGNIEKYGFDAIDLHLQNDSTSLTLEGAVHQKDTVSIQLLDDGPFYEKQEYTKTLANFHLDITRLRKAPDDPIFRLLNYWAAKISFPLKDFLAHWDGAVAFRQGGLQSYSEKFITSELDENFNVTEVVKYKTVKLPGFSIYLGMRPNYTDFINRLMVKGILTKPDRRYRLLFSPPLALQQEDTAVALHTATYFERPKTGTQNSAFFTHEKTAYEFYMDSIGTQTYFCRLRIPLEELVSKYIPADEL
jgi:hypothetical protein